jgi:HEAT repeat protein
MKSRRFFIVVMLAVLAGITTFSIFCSLPRQQEGDGKNASEPAKLNRAKKSLLTEHSKSTVQEVLASRKIPSSRIGGKPGFEAFLDGMSADDRKLVLAVQEALDNDDFKSVSAAAKRAVKSSNPDVRSAAVEALGWFGPEALPELTPLMADPDEDVAQTAATQWELALGEIDDGATRASIAEATMRALKNKDVLQSIVCEITNQDDDLVILESLVSLIQDSNEACAEVAREAYETTTGEEWAGIEAANAWLEENYDPPQENQ